MKRYGLGAVNYYTGQTVVLFRRRKRRCEVAELFQTLLDKHPTGTIFVIWDNADTHCDDEVEVVLRAAAGRGCYRYLSTYSPWLSPVEIVWQHLRREVTRCNSSHRTVFCAMIILRPSILAMTVIETAHSSQLATRFLPM